MTPVPQTPYEKQLLFFDITPKSRNEEKKKEQEDKKKFLLPSKFLTYISQIIRAGEVKYVKQLETFVNLSSLQRYYVEFESGKKVIVRLYLSKNLASHEHKILKLLQTDYEGAKCSPEPYFCEDPPNDFFKNHGFFVNEFIDLTSCAKTPYFGDNLRLKSISKILRNIHSIHSETRIDRYSSIQNFLFDNLEYNPMDNDFDVSLLDEVMSENIPEFGKEFKKLLFMILNHKFLSLVEDKLFNISLTCLIHGNIHPGNVIMNSSESLYFIGFEKSQFNTFYFDLACVIVLGMLSRKHEKLFLKYYSSSDCNDSDDSSDESESESSDFRKYELIDLNLLWCFKVKCSLRIVLMFCNDSLNILNMKKNVNDGLMKYIFEIWKYLNKLLENPPH